MRVLVSDDHGYTGAVLALSPRVAGPGGGGQ
jgi:hypothetical protein